MHARVIYYYVISPPPLSLYILYLSSFSFLLSRGPQGRGECSLPHRGSGVHAPTLSSGSIKMGLNGDKHTRLASEINRDEYKREREREVLVLEYNQVTVFMEKEKLDAIRRSLHGS